MVLLLVVITNGLSQRIFVTGERHVAEFDVIFTRNLWQADICMRTVAYEHQAGRARTSNGCDGWFFVDHAINADITIRIVNSRHPGRPTLYVYRNNNANYSPPLRDRNDYEFDDNERYRGSYYDNEPYRDIRPDPGTGYYRVPPITYTVVLRDPRISILLNGRWPW